MEGNVAFQVGEQRVQLRAGESVLPPRRVPQTFSSDQRGWRNGPSPAPTTWSALKPRSRSLSERLSDDKVLHACGPRCGALSSRHRETPPHSPARCFALEPRVRSRNRLPRPCKIDLCKNASQAFGLAIHFRVSIFKEFLRLIPTAVH